MVQKFAVEGFEAFKAKSEELAKVCVMCMVCVGMNVLQKCVQRRLILIVNLLD